MPAYKAAAAVPVPFTWTGFYIGGFAGGAWGGVSASPLRSVPGGAAYNQAITNDYGLGSSFIGGGTVGYNWQIAGPVVIGVEGEIGYLRLSASAVDPGSLGGIAGGDTVSSTRVGDWYGVVAGRFGLAADRFLAYGKVGAAFLRVETGYVDTCTVAPCGPATVNTTTSKTVTSLALGGGLEWAWTNNWSIKAEYLRFGFIEDINTCGVAGGGLAGITECSLVTIKPIDTFKAGLNYRF
jgi:outer membrane immunogenic protein